MAMTKTNNECLTFEEWACAAGVAKFDGNKFIPMETEHSHIFNYSVYIRDGWASGVDPAEWKLTQRKPIA